MCSASQRIASFVSVDPRPFRQSLQISGNMPPGNTGYPGTRIVRSNTRAPAAEVRHAVRLFTRRQLVVPLEYHRLVERSCYRQLFSDDGMLWCLFCPFFSRALVSLDGKNRLAAPFARLRSAFLAPPAEILPHGFARYAHQNLARSPQECTPASSRASAAQLFSCPERKKGQKRRPHHVSESSHFH